MSLYDWNYHLYNSWRQTKWWFAASKEKFSPHKFVGFKSGHFQSDPTSTNAMTHSLVRTISGVRARECVCVRACECMWERVGESEREREREWLEGEWERHLKSIWAWNMLDPCAEICFFSLSIYFSLFLDLPLFSVILNYILSFFPSSVSFFLLILILYQSLTLSIVIHQCPSISLSLSPSLSCSLPIWLIHS